MATAVPAIIRKSATRLVAENPEAKTFVFVASDNSVDRYGDTIDAKGWELANFERNPVILLNHKQAELPIGRAVKTWIEGNQLKVEVKFADAEINPLGPKVERAVREGYMRALSVGFKPIESTIADDRKSDGWYPATNFKRQELLEISVVTVPANPNALIDAKAAGEDLEWVRELALRTLEATDGPGRWIPATVARAFDAPAPKLDPAQAPAAPEAKGVTESEVAALIRSAGVDLAAEVKRQVNLKRTGKLS